MIRFALRLGWVELALQRWTRQPGRRLAERIDLKKNEWLGEIVDEADTFPKRATLEKTSHRPWPLPAEPWTMTQRWNDLLFAHWPMRIAEIEDLLPDGLEADVFQGSAWIGVVPFW